MSCRWVRTSLVAKKSSENLSRMNLMNALLLTQLYEQKLENAVSLRHSTMRVT
jgi:hypothetical protein